MKALSTTILIVVTAVVILVAALVVLTIFGGGVGTVSTVTAFKSQCITQCQITCKMGGLPPTWNVEVNVEGQKKTCAGETLVPGPQCSGVCGGTSTSTPSGGICQYPACPQAPGVCISPAECQGLR